MDSNLDVQKRKACKDAWIKAYKLAKDAGDDALQTVKKAIDVAVDAQQTNKNGAVAVQELLAELRNQNIGN